MMEHKTKPLIELEKKAIKSKVDLELAAFSAAATLTPAVIAINTLLDTLPRDCIYVVDGMGSDKILNGINYAIKGAIKELQAAYQYSVDWMVEDETPNE